MRLASLATALIALAAPDTGRGDGSLHVAEIVTFRLQEGADPAAFAEEARGMTPFLLSTGAVLARTLSVDDTGTWTDHIVWTGMEAALEAAAAMMEDPAAAPFMALIDPASVSMRHARVTFALTPE